MIWLKSDTAGRTVAVGIRLGVGEGTTVGVAEGTGVDSRVVASVGGGTAEGITPAGLLVVCAAVHAVDIAARSVQRRRIALLEVNGSLVYPLT